MSRGGDGREGMDGCARSFAQLCLTLCDPIGL